MHQTASEITKAFFGPSAQEKPRTPYLLRLDTARALLVTRGLMYSSSVFITSLSDNIGELASEESRKPGQTFEVWGEYAAVRLADRTHRLAHTEEIQRFKDDQRAREQVCEDLESLKPENQLRNVVAQSLRIAANPREDRSPAPLIAPPAAAEHNIHPQPVTRRDRTTEQQPASAQK